MRPACSFCARKHLAQALVLLNESRQGYPFHFWLAIGHLAEAADELIWSPSPKLRDVAARIRLERKDLELGQGHEVPILDILQQIDDAEAWMKPVESPKVVIDEDELWRQVNAARAEPGHSRDHTVSETGTSFIPPVPAVPCPPCEEARKKREAALKEASEAIRAKEVEASVARGDKRLLLITTLGDFNPSYSLTTVILDQAHAAALAGFSVDILVNTTANLELCPALHAAITVHKVVPTFQWKEDVVDEEMATSVLPDLLAEWMERYKPSLVIEHDLMHQTWFVTYARAFHVAEQTFGLSRLAPIYHMAHSAPGPVPPPVVEGSASYWRRRLPPGHKLLVCNQELVRSYCAYYSVAPKNVAVLTNARDVRVFHKMPSLASRIITRLQLHRADIVQVYPFSVERWRPKGVETLLDVFQALDATGMKVKLVLAVSNAVGDEAAKHLNQLHIEIAKRLLMGVVTVTAVEWPQSASRGLSADEIRSLFAVSNLFVFPTKSEAASLILREAALSGCLLVLNDSVEQLKGCIGHDSAWFWKWDTLAVTQDKQAPEYKQALKYLADKIVDHLLVRDRQNVLKRMAMSKFSLEAMGEGLLALVKGAGPVEGQGQVEGLGWDGKTWRAAGDVGSG